jgi:hypothetical protein
MMSAILLLFSFGGTVYPERSEGHTLVRHQYFQLFLFLTDDTDLHRKLICDHLCNR